MMNQNNGGNYEVMIRELGRVITYVKENPEEFNFFCEYYCNCGKGYGAHTPMKHAPTATIQSLEEARALCPIFGSEDPVADFDKQYKLALIKGDI